MVAGFDTISEFDASKIDKDMSDEKLTDGEIWQVIVDVLEDEDYELPIGSTSPDKSDYLIDLVDSLSTAIFFVAIDDHYPGSFGRDICEQAEYETVTLGDIMQRIKFVYKKL